MAQPLNITIGTLSTTEWMTSEEKNPTESYDEVGQVGRLGYDWRPAPPASKPLHPTPQLKGAKHHETKPTRS